MAEFSRAKIWGVFCVLFLCGALVGVGIANWGHATKAKRALDTNIVAEQQAGEGGVRDAIVAFVEKERAKDADKQELDETLTACQSIEKVLLNKLRDDDSECWKVQEDLAIYKKLATYGCDENQEKYKQEIENKTAILSVACNESGEVIGDVRPCEQIEQNLIQTRNLNHNYTEMGPDERIDRAKTYAIMAERGCPENTQKYTDLARKELEIARGISDDALSEGDTIEVVETYKRLKMQQDAEEVFNKVKKMTNPTIDFIIELEKIINE